MLHVARVVYSLLLCVAQKKEEYFERKSPLFTSYIVKGALQVQTKSDLKQAR